MALWAKAIGKLVAVLFVGSIIEGCVLRDPWVELNNGYNIGAISWGSPCHLTYYKSQDRRPPSPWVLFITGDNFALHNTETDEWREYESESALREAARDLAVRPAPGQILLDGVTGFDASDHFAIGHSADGYFLLDMTTDALEKWPTQEEWTAAVRSRTNLDPQHLRDPKSWWLQYRHAGYWTIMGVYLALGFSWIAAPFLRRPASTLPNAT